MRSWLVAGILLAEALFKPSSRRMCRCHRESCTEMYVVVGYFELYRKSSAGLPELGHQLLTLMCEFAMDSVK
jgi:hypothetical protein